MTRLAVIRSAQKIRRESPMTSAGDAVRLARWRLDAPSMEDGETWTSDGFDLRVSVTPDDWPYDGDDTPRFVSARDISPAERRESVSVRGYMWADDDYAETPYYPKSERVENYRRRGASRSVAEELATADMLREIRESHESQSTTYVVTVSVSRAGVTLGRASLGGVTFGEDYGDSLRYVAETAGELESEAIEDARATRARICSAD